MNTMLDGNDGAVLRKASLFRKVRALTHAMRKGDAWSLDGAFRSKIRHGDQCPLTFCAGERGDQYEEVHRSARRLGFNDYDELSIMFAADRSNMRRELRRDVPKLRRILLRAAGLSGALRTNPPAP